MWNGPNEPYQDLPKLPPAVDLETPQVLKAAINATRPLANLNGSCQLLPDPAMLIHIIPILEAQASSEIENIVTTNDELFRAASGGENANTTPATKEALRYQGALYKGFNLMQDRPLTSNTAKEVCTYLLGYNVDVRSNDGTYIGNPKTRERIYTPPQGKAVIESHLRDWERFVHDFGDLDPLVALALAHYQFKVIHPFSDGNGRTGRIMNLLFLKEHSLLELPVLYLSGYIVRHKDAYYRLLRGVTERGEWTAWIIFILRAIEQTSLWTLDLIEKTRQLQNEFERQIAKISPRLPALELTRIMFSQPYMRIDNVTEKLKCSRPTASKWLGELTGIGLLQLEKVGRTNLYVNEQLLNLLFTASHTG